MTDVEPDTTSAPGRAGRREANLRRLNERIVDAGEQLAGGDSQVVDILCECARDRCDDVIRMHVDQFEALRDDVDRFAVIEGHVLQNVEDVEEGHDGWVVVRKRGEAAREAARHLS